MARIWSITWHTFKEAARDRVLYNLIVFALLMIGASILFGQISVGIEGIILVDLGLSSIAVFGVRSRGPSLWLFFEIQTIFLSFKSPVEFVRPDTG